MKFDPGFTSCTNIVPISCKKLQFRFNTAMKCLCCQTHRSHRPEHRGLLSTDTWMCHTYRADWLAWLGVLTTVGSGEGLLCGGGGLSGSSASSRGSSLMCTGGSTGPRPPQVTDAGSGMEMEEDAAVEDGGCKLGRGLDADGGAPVGGRTVLNGCDENGGCGGPPGCEAATEGGRGGAGGGWWLDDGGRLWDWVRTGGWAGGG